MEGRRCIGYFPKVVQDVGVVALVVVRELQAREDAVGAVVLAREGRHLGEGPEDDVVEQRFSSRPLIVGPRPVRQGFVHRAFLLQGKSRQRFHFRLASVAATEHCRKPALSESLLGFSDFWSTVRWYNGAVRRNRPRQVSAACRPRSVPASTVPTARFVARTR